MNCVKDAMLLYAVTDRAWTGKMTLLQQIEAALQGGSTCVQLREKDLSADEFLREAIEVRKLCHKYGVMFIVNDNVDIAIKANADGIHVGQHDMSSGQVRQLIGKNMILGVSAQTVERHSLLMKTVLIIWVSALFSLHLPNLTPTTFH